jgi:hypothetical protein
MWDEGYNDRTLMAGNHTIDHNEENLERINLLRRRRSLSGEESPPIEESPQIRRRRQIEGSDATDDEANLETVLHYPVVHNVDVALDDDFGNGGVVTLSAEEYRDYRSESGLSTEVAAICVICQCALFEGIQDICYNKVCIHRLHSDCAAQLISSQAEDIGDNFFQHQLIQVGKCPVCNKVVRSWLEVGVNERILPVGQPIYGVHIRKRTSSEIHWYSNYITDPNLWYILYRELPKRPNLPPVENPGEKTEVELMEYYDKYLLKFEGTFECQVCHNIDLSSQIQVYNENCNCALMCNPCCLQKIALVVVDREKHQGVLTCNRCSQKGRMKNHFGVYVMDSSPLLRRSNRFAQPPARMITEE